MFDRNRHKRFWDAVWLFILIMINLIGFLCSIHYWFVAVSYRYAMWVQGSDKPVFCLPKGGAGNAFMTSLSWLAIWGTLSHYLTSFVVGTGFGFCITTVISIFVHMKIMEHRFNNNLHNVFKYVRTRKSN